MGDLTRTCAPTKTPATGKGKTGWDQDFRQRNFGKPLCLPDEDLKYLEAGVNNDCALLAHLELIDYSMLLAAAPPDDEDSMGILGLGIIDWLRPYTWDKRAESGIKSLLHPGELPTVIPQREYAVRFRAAMGTYFVGDSSPTTS